MLDDFLCQQHSDEAPQGWYDEPDLRDNAEREFIGLQDWQSEMPLVEPTPESEEFEKMFS